MSTAEIQLQVRKITSTDCNAVYIWRNHPDTRRYFFDPSPITLEDHVQWFAEVLNDPERHLLAIENHRGEPVGVIRFDATNQEGTASVDIYLVPEKRGFGLGAPMLLAGLKWLKINTAIRRITADVLAANKSSCRMFDAAGFNLALYTFTFELESSNT